jgi:glycine cleavage system H protein
MVTLTFIGLILLFMLLDLFVMRDLEKAAPSLKDNKGFGYGLDHGHGDHGPGAEEILLPKGYYLHPGHAWAHVMKDGKVAVGVDDVVQSAAGNVTGVELPDTGAELKAGSGAFKIKVGGRELEIAAPIDGQVLTVNDGLAGEPGLVNSDPYGSGWIGPAPPAAGADLGLPKDGSAVEWLGSEIEKLHEFIAHYRKATSLKGMLTGASDLTWSLFQTGFLSREASKEA